MNELHPNRIRAIREAYDAGMSHRVAAAHCGVGRHTVARYYARWSNSDFGGVMQCYVKGETKTRWKEEALKRELSVQGLMAFIVETIAEENLFNAVIDEAPAVIEKKIKRKNGEGLAGAI